MAYIVSSIIEARINSLIRERDQAIRDKDYDRAWRMNMKISNNISRLIAYC